MKKFYRSSAGTLAAAAFAAAAFASASNADSIVTVNADGSVTNGQAPQGNTRQGYVPKGLARQGQQAGQKSGEIQPDLGWQEVDASVLLQAAPALNPDSKADSSRRFDSTARVGAENANDPSLLAVKRDLARYPRGQVKIVNGKTLWVSGDGDVTIIGDNNRIIIAPRPGYYHGGYYGYRPPYYGYYNYSTMIFSAFSPGYVFYTSGIPGYLYKVPVGNGQIIGGYPVYGYPGYGYPDYGYGYPGYGYPAYGYPGYHSYTTTFGGPGSITSTYRSETRGTGIGVSVGKGGVGVNLGGGKTTTTSKSTIEANMAPGTTITTTKTYPTYGYPSFGNPGFGTPPHAFGTQPQSVVSRPTVNTGTFIGSGGSRPNTQNLTPPASPVMIRPRSR